MAAQAGILNARQQRAQPLIERGAAFGAVEHLAGGLALPEQPGHRHRAFDQGAHRPGTAGAQHIVRVLTGRQQTEAQPLPGGDQRQRQFRQPLPGAQPRRVAIERHHRLVMQPPQQPQLILGDGGAQRRHRPLISRADQRDDIHIALGHDQRRALAHRRAGRRDVEKRAALVEQLGLGRIEVFGLGIGRQRAAPESDAAAARIADRKHDAAAKPVIGGAAVIGASTKPGGDDILARHAGAGQMCPECLPGIGREADAETLALQLRQAPPVQIAARAGCRRAIELHAKEARGGLHHLGQGALAVFLLRRAGIARRHRQAGLAGQQFHRFHETQILGLAQEAQRIPLRMTAEAIIIALAVIDMERSRAFLMEGARRPVIALAGVGFAHVPADLAADHLRDGNARAQFVQESGWQGHDR